MAAMDEQQVGDSVTKANMDSTTTQSEREAEEQAVAETTDPFDDPATHGAGVLSPRASSAGLSDDVSDSRSGNSGNTSSASKLCLA